MSTSDRKIRANRRNAEKSTGPNTDEGKETSRANAYKHGLSGAGVVMGADEAEAVAQRAEAWRPEFRPDSPVKEWAFEQVVIHSMRIDQCQSQQQTAREFEAMRAESVWEIDQDASAAVLGDRLARKPEMTARQLLRTKAGCSWMMEQWSSLGRILDAGHDWTDEQRHHALDLTGAPRFGRDEAPLNHPKQLVETQFARLNNLIATHHDNLDAFERSAAAKGCPGSLSKTISLLRRYEAACLKRFNAARKMLGAVAVDPQTEEAVPVSPPKPFSTPFLDDLDSDDVPEESLEDYAERLEGLTMACMGNAELATQMAGPPPAPLPPPPAPVPARSSNPGVPPHQQKIPQAMNRRQRRAMAKMMANAL